MPPTPPSPPRTFSPATLTEHFTLLPALLRDLDIPPRNVYNYAELKLRRGFSHFTLLEAASAAGDVPPATFALTSVPPYLWNVRGVLGLQVEAHGHPDNETREYWFCAIFLPHATVNADADRPILLMFYGDDAFDLVVGGGHNVLLYCLPPRKMQPLDAVFGPLHASWRRHTRNGGSATQEEVVREYMEMRRRYMKPKRIRAAFRSAGMFGGDARDADESEDTEREVRTTTASMLLDDCSEDTEREVRTTTASVPPNDDSEDTEREVCTVTASAAPSGPAQVATRARGKRLSWLRAVYRRGG